MLSSSFVALFASAALVAAHGTVTDVIIGDKHYPGTKNYDAPENDQSPVRGIPTDTGFVRYDRVNTPDIACSSAGYKPRKVTPEVPAGGQVGVRWGGDGGPDKKQWPHPEGPALAYMASCNGKCSEFDPSNAQFFKIAEEGLDTSKRPNAAGNDHTPAGDGMWAQNRIQYENSYHFVTIPSNIPAGEYLLRHELISLHGASNYGEGAQYYPACIQIKVTGGGNSYPATTPATQLYKTEDGIIDIYSPSPSGIRNYKAPGPALYAGVGASGGASAKTNTTPEASNNYASAPASEPNTKSGYKACKAKRSTSPVGAQARHAAKRASY